MNGQCQQKDELIQKVQQHLLRLAELAKREAKIIRDTEDVIWLAIDKEIENEIGSKERCLGALKQHQKEHGC